MSSYPIRADLDDPFARRYRAAILAEQGKVEESMVRFREAMHLAAEETKPGVNVRTVLIRRLDPGGEGARKSLKQARVLARRGP